MRLASGVVLEPSSCRVAKERVLRRSAEVADCNFVQVAQVDMFAEQAGRNHSLERVALKLDIARHSMTIAP